MRPLIILSMALLASCRPPVQTTPPTQHYPASIPPDEKELLIKGERDLKEMDSIIHNKKR